jgi:hypothetical protein
MPRRNETSEVIDALLRLAALGGLTATALLAPNAVQLFDKPIQKYMNKMDAKQRRREMNRLLSYTRQHKLITEDYQHGLQISDKARQRLEKLDIDSLQIQSPKEWDNRWRITFYDIPEQKKSARNALSFKLRQLGCYQLQRSVWVHPFPFDKELTTIAAAYGVEKYMTYIEATRINNATLLRKKFADLV